MIIQTGGGNCSLCGSPGTNKTTCPLNPAAVNKNHAKHPNAGKAPAKGAPPLKAQVAPPLLPPKAKSPPKVPAKLKAEYGKPALHPKLAKLDGTIVYAVMRDITHGNGWSVSYMSFDREVAVSATKLMNGKKVRDIRVVALKMDKEYDVNSKQPLIVERRSTGADTPFSAFSGLPAMAPQPKPIYAVVTLTDEGLDVPLLITSELHKATALASRSPSHNIYINPFNSVALEGCINEWDLYEGDGDDE